MNSYLVVVDVGNTSTSLGLVRGGRVLRVGRLPTHGGRAADRANALARLAGSRSIEGAALCSVVPAGDAAWMRALRRIAARPPLRVRAGLDLGVAIRYPRPATIGADRLANASAALARYGSPVIVADFGTALTFDVVVDGAYVGGVIAPGLPLMTDYLAERTALLPHLRLAGGRAPDARRLPAIGTSTREAMAIGARVGYLGMIREIMARLRKAVGNPAPAFCATGGYAAWALAGYGEPVTIDPDLTLAGIARIYRRNQPPASGRPGPPRAGRAPERRPGRHAS